MLSGSYFGTLYAFPDYQPRFTDLLLAVPLGLIGALAGAIFIVVFKQLRQIMQPLKQALDRARLHRRVGIGYRGRAAAVDLVFGRGADTPR